MIARRATADRTQGAREPRAAHALGEGHGPSRGEKKTGAPTWGRGVNDSRIRARALFLVLAEGCRG